MSKTKLLLLYGGRSSEHEISLISAASVLANLDANKFEIIPVGMDKEGCFFENNYYELLAFPDVLPVITSNSLPMPSLLIDGRLAIETDVVFPVVHGPLYEDGCLQGLLELSGSAYVGSGVLSSALGMDKDMSRRLVCNERIRSARYFTLSGYSPSAERQEFCRKVAAKLGWPLFVKPCSLGSSVGIHKVKNLNELTHAVEDALRYDETILVEEFIVGREIELAVLEDLRCPSKPRVSLAGEIFVNHPDGFYSYTAKYLESEQTELRLPAKLDDKVLEQLQSFSAEVFTRLKCRGMARVDFFVNEQLGEIYFNEINTLPGFTSISMYPRLWQLSGLEYKDLLSELINLAIMRQDSRRRLIISYQ